MINQNMTQVCVYLVGAGPGDVGLITQKAIELLRKADVVIYDYLAAPALLAYTKEATEKIFVGKKGHSKHITQDDINDLLIRVAREQAMLANDTAQKDAKKIIVRLKGGDPFLFGRGGEEALALHEARIPFEVVPGVTSGIAAPAYAGIPVTHRGIASTVTFVTGHEDPTKNESAIDWKSLARMVLAGGTICFYMGMKNLDLIISRLQEGGLTKDCPIGLVQWGTTTRQRSLLASFDTVARRVAEEKFGAPAIIVVGDVVTLSKKLEWYENKPLYGKEIVVTRSRKQASNLVKDLQEEGAQVFEFPTIEFSKPDSYEPLDQALARLETYDWVVFTSVNGVDAFFDRLQGDARLLSGICVAAIGPSTKARLKTYGIIADAMPSNYRGEAVFAAIEEVCRRTNMSLSGSKILLPRAAVARVDLPMMLKDAGAVVDVVPVYKTILPEHALVDELVSKLKSNSLAGITFTSSSTAENLISLLKEDAVLLKNVTLFSIGPITSATLKHHGLFNIVESSIYTIDGLVDSINKTLGMRV